MIGLLEKARKLRTSLGLPADGRDEFAFDPDSGISREEQTEIRAEIEKVATGSRIAVSPELFAVKAAKRGVLFPIVVNVAAVVALAIGLAVFYFYFQRGETQLSRADTGTITAEGKLIAQVKKESDAKLLEKNQQINQIQGRLADIDKQRLDLQANMDAKVQDRENQLKADMSAALDAEKARLQKQGLSDQDIAKKLADLQTQQNAAFTKQLDTFKAQADADRKKSESTLKTLQDQFNADLAKANADRQQVMADSRQREADLQAQLAQKTKELQTAQVQTQAQLSALTSQKQQEDLVSQQLVGLYSIVKSDIAAKDYTKAFTSLQAIAGYVNSADVAVLPGMAKRRTVDLFIVDSLTGLVQGEMDKSKVDTASLVNAANQLADVRAKVADADAQVRAGKLPEAEKLYNQALAVVPEIVKSYAYFTSKAKDAESARQDAMRAGLARAEAAFDTGRFPDMLAAYRDALAYLPETSARLERTLSNIAAAGAAANAAAGAAQSQKAQADQSRAAAPLLAQADSLLKQGQHADAAAQYLAILSSYPQSSQAPHAVKGITDSLTGMRTQAAAAQSAQKSLGDSIASLKQEISARKDELDGIRKSAAEELANAAATSSDYAARLSTALDRNLALQKQIDGLRAELANTNATANQQNAKVDAAETKQPQISPDRLASLQSGYKSYMTNADKALQGQGDLGLMRAKGYLDTFLGSGPMEGTFPGLLQYIQQFDRGFESAGRSTALQDAMGIVIDFSKSSSADERAAFFSKQLKAWDKDPDMKSFLQALQRLAR